MKSKNLLLAVLFSPVVAIYWIFSLFLGISKM